MGKISKVYYEAMDHDKCSMMETGEFYYHYNLMGVHPMFIPEYEKYEMSQISMRNKIIGDAMKCGDISIHPKMNTTIFGVSSIKHKAVIVTEC